MGRHARGGDDEMPQLTTAAHAWHIHHLEVRTAYFYSPMDVEVYINAPDGFEAAGEDAIRDFSLYATKKAGNIRGNHLLAMLSKEGESQAPAERCLFIFRIWDDVVYVEAHVGDLLVISALLDAVEHVKGTIKPHYEARDLGKVSSYLAMETKRNRDIGYVPLATLGTS